MPAPFSRESRTPSFRHRHPEYPFLSQSRTRAQTLANPDSRIAVKSRIPITFPESRTAFLVKSRIPLKISRFGQIPCPDNVSGFPSCILAE